MIPILLSCLKVVLATLFIFSSLSKLLAVSESKEFIQSFGFVKTWKLVLTITIFTEFILGSLLLTNVANSLVLILLFLLVAFFSGLLMYTISKKRDIACACFGSFSEAKVTSATVARNASIIILIFVALLLELNSPTISLIRLVLLEDFTQSLPGSWFRDLALLPLLLLTSMQLVQLSHSRGRANRHATTTSVPIKTQQPNLNVGQTVPEFHLVSPNDEIVISRYVLDVSQPTVVFFTLSDCEPCLELMPKIREFQVEFSQIVQTLVISEGDHKKNLDKAKDFGVDNIFLQQRGENEDMGEISQLFHVEGFPCHVVLSEKNIILTLPTFGLPDTDLLQSSP